MIGLGLRLTLSGGREAITRFLVLAVAVGLGVGLLLTAVAATNAALTWNNRHGWFWTGTASVPAGPAAPGIAPLWWHPGSDMFGGRPITRFDVAATGASSPVPPGLPRDPGPDQYYASPALAALLRSTPASQLADRYPGRLAGVIGDAALPSPDSLVIVIGHTPAQLAGTPDSVSVTSIATAVPGNQGGQVNPKGLDYVPPDPGGGQSAVDLLLSVVALALLAPVLIFIATATRLSAARREQRFAAMRLVGATRKQVSWLAATESTAAAVAGVASGFGIFFLQRIPVAGIPFIGQPFFPAELSLSLPDVLAVAIGVPVAAAVAARLALHRVRISPLGVARRTTPRPPRAWRILPLLAGFAELGFFTVHGKPTGPSGPALAFVPGFALIIVGLVLAGPWLTMAAARLMARRTSRAGTLIAARRLADDPRAAFRAVSGLVLALFVTTVAVVGITTWKMPSNTTQGQRRRGERADRPAGGPAARDGPPGGRYQPGTGRARRAARGTAARDSRCPGGGRSPRGPGADYPRGMPQPHAAPALSRPAWSRARSSRPFPSWAAAPPGRPRRRSRPTGSPGLYPPWTPPGSPGQPRTSRPPGWTASPWTPSTWRRTAPGQRSSRLGRSWRRHTPMPSTSATACRPPWVS